MPIDSCNQYTCLDKFFYVCQLTFISYFNLLQKNSTSEFIGKIDLNY